MSAHQIVSVVVGDVRRCAASRAACGLRHRRGRRESATTPIGSTAHTPRRPSPTTRGARGFRPNRRQGNGRTAQQRCAVRPSRRPPASGNAPRAGSNIGGTSPGRYTGSARRSQSTSTHPQSGGIALSNQPAQVRVKRGVCAISRLLEGGDPSRELAPQRRPARPGHVPRPANRGPLALPLPRLAPRV